jgi:hypothetical protein
VITVTLATMSHSNRVPNLRRPFVICFGCDTVEALTRASETGWALVFRSHRMFGYHCPSCQDPAAPDGDAARLGGAESIPAQNHRTREDRAV